MNILKRRLIQSLYLIFLCGIFVLEFVTCSKIGQVLPVSGEEKGYIKWIDFDVTSAAMKDAMKLDIESYNTENHIDFVTSLSLLATKYGGDFKKYKKADLTEYKTRLESGESAEDITPNKKTLAYYKSAFSAVLGGAVGEYAVAVDPNEKDGLFYEKRYGLKLFSPIAEGYYYSHFDDFGASRSYGYKRPHLGHDMMGSVGTPIIAVESGYVEAAGWNQYGGWRVGIRSFDGKRYYYYAHLRKGHPFNDMYEGKIVNAGEVIGYLGMTGYSAKEDTNNINTPHLHFGLQIIFDKSQKDGYNQIWLDMYEFSNFLYQNRAKVYYDGESKEYYSNSAIIDLSAPD